MRAPGRPGPLSGGLLAGGLIVACCALGPAVVVAGVAGTLAGLGAATWSLVAAGLSVALVGAALIVRTRRAASCRPPAGRAPHVEDR
jgi:hypothetical protein